MSSEGAGASRAAGDGFRSEDKFLVNKGLGLYIVCDGRVGESRGLFATADMYVSDN